MMETGTGTMPRNASRTTEKNCMTKSASQKPSPAQRLRFTNHKEAMTAAQTLLLKR
jgi:hypothetical protein